MVTLEFRWGYSRFFFELGGEPGFTTVAQVESDFAEADLIVKKKFFYRSIFCRMIYRSMVIPSTCEQSLLTEGYSCSGFLAKNWRNFHPNLDLYDVLYRFNTGWTTPVFYQNFQACFFKSSEDYHYPKSLETVVLKLA